MCRPFSLRVTATEQTVAFRSSKSVPGRARTRQPRENRMRSPKFGTELHGNAVNLLTAFDRTLSVAFRIWRLLVQHVIQERTTCGDNDREYCPFAGLPDKTQQMRVLEIKLQHAFVGALIATARSGSVLAAVVLGTKIAHLGNGSIHDDRTRVVRASVGASTGAGPGGKSEARIGFCFNDHTRPGVMPAAGRLHCAASSRAHRQEVLRLERCRVGLVAGRSDNVRDRSVVTPFLPDILHTCAVSTAPARSNP